MVYQDNGLRIYFGDKSTALDRELLNRCPSPELLQTGAVARYTGSGQLVTLKQVHGTQGQVITPETVAHNRHAKLVGDYLITNMLDTGLAVYTADCLPIILYDPRNRAIAVCHAGWPGSVGGIAAKALEHMGRVYTTRPADSRVFFGPCARVCCYAVSPEFKTKLSHLPYVDQLLILHNGQYYFDLVQCNKLQLQHLGVPEHAFIDTYALCTMCVERFCSHRKDSTSQKRQLTVALMFNDVL